MSDNELIVELLLERIQKNVKTILHGTREGLDQAYITGILGITVPEPGRDVIGRCVAEQEQCKRLLKEHYEMG